MSDDAKKSPTRYYVAAAVVVIAVVTLAVMGRYSLTNDNGPGAMRLDRWTGDVQRVDGKAKPQEPKVDPFFADILPDR